MKKIIALLPFLFTVLIVVAQEDKSHEPQQQNQQQSNNPVNPVTNQFQNGNEMGWEAQNITTIEANKLPGTISTDFTTRYSNQSNVMWYQYDKGYTATYQDKNGKWQRVMYDQNGKPTGTAIQIKSDQLPPPAVAFLQKNYSNATYDKIYEVTGSSGEKTYEVYANGRWIAFDSKGSMMTPK